jgi:alpha-N-arabinofuranosidase
LNPTKRFPLLTFTFCFAVSLFSIGFPLGGLLLSRLRDEFIMKNLTLILLFLFNGFAAAWAMEPTLRIDAGKSVGKVSPMLYGLMTEEINHSLDGGIYAELVQNRALQDDATNPVHWTVVQRPGDAIATMALDRNGPLNEQLATSLRLDAKHASPAAPVGVANEGYWGIPVKPDTRYRASFYARAVGGAAESLTVAIESDDGKITYAKAEVPRLTADWQPYTVTLTTGKDVTPTTKARLTLTVQHPGKVWFNLVSLFPPTWKDRPNGLRPDLMQMLVDLQPDFLHFPGGLYLEGGTIDTRFDWKKTIGPIAQRAGHPGPWRYRSTDGLGLLEFLQWSEDMGSESVIGLYAGYSINGESVKPGPALEPFVKDALDEIEYAIGPVTSKWGAQRAKDGHPAPFPLHYVEIGNEDWSDRTGSYDLRFAQFFDAIKRNYPALKCISTIGGEQSVAKRVQTRKPDVLDEHYYRSDEVFLKDAPTHFEKYDRAGPEICVGEWAAHETGFPPWDKRSRAALPTPNMKAALGDAAWMATMERNSDIVTMQCYAPLFVNVNPGASQWRPNLIGYDGLRAYGSPSYYAFQMFSRNHGDEILKGTLSGAPLHFTATKDSKTGGIFIKVVNPEAAPQPLKITLKDAGALAPTGKVITLATEKIDDTNSIDEPTKVVPVTTTLDGIKQTFTYTFAPYSVTVLQLGAAP